MRLLVCGGRHLNDAALIRQELTHFHSLIPVTVLIHGGHATLGSILEDWARENCIHVVRYPPKLADIGKTGRSDTERLHAGGQPARLPVCAPGWTTHAGPHPACPGAPHPDRWRGISRVRGGRTGGGSHEPHPSQSRSATASGQSTRDLQFKRNRAPLLRAEHGTSAPADRQAGVGADREEGAQARRGRIGSSILGASFLVAFLSASPAKAGPYVVDDAGIGDVGDCEISAWHTHVESGLSSTAVAAACVVLPGLELSATGFRVNENGGVFAAELEAKFGLIEKAEHGVGVALVAMSAPSPPPSLRGAMLWGM